MLLTLASESGKILAQATLKNVDPSDALVAVLGALKPLPEVTPPGTRKERSDKGKPKPKKPAADPTPE